MDIRSFFGKPKESSVAKSVVTESDSQTIDLTHAADTSSTPSRPPRISPDPEILSKTRESGKKSARDASPVAKTNAGSSSTKKAKMQKKEEEAAVTVPSSASKKRGAATEATASTTITGVDGTAKKVRVPVAALPATAIAEPSSALSKAVTAPAPAAKSFPFYGGARASPLLGEGAVEIPVGAPMCLDGLKIAVTGVMDALGREQIEGLILQYGGKNASNISGKTDFLVAGTILDDGRPVNQSSKYRTALEKKVPIVSEAEFLDRIRSSATQLPGGGSETAMKTEKQSPAEFKPVSLSSSSSYTSSASSSSSLPPRPPPSQHSQRPTGQSTVDPDSLWVDKYKPSKISEIIGNGDIAKKLQDWCRQWEGMHVRKTIPFPKGAPSKENPHARAVLLSGPPGIGKTTLVTLVAKELGYETLELNASDTRSKNAITEQLADVVKSHAMSIDGSSTRKRLVIMDEVDGMGAGDRAGIPELIKVIKTSKNPIVCICNDRQSQKIRSLANHCYDLRVRRPTKAQIAQRMVTVARQEGMDLEPNAAEMLTEQMGNDIRQVLNCLQMWRSRSSSMRFSDVKDQLQRIEKDKVLRQSPFDACLSLLGGPKTSFDERYNAFFIDYSLVPLLVQQNYIDASKSGIFRAPGVTEDAALAQLSKAADAVSDMDLAGSAIRGNDQHWELLPTQALMAVRAGSFVRGFQAFPAFPAWLGKNSTTSKSVRLVRELVAHSSLAVGQGFLPIRLDYVPYLRTRLLQLLLDKGSDGVEEVMHLLDVYGFSKDDFSDSMKDLMFTAEKDPLLQDKYEVIDSKTKAALTRLYNSTEHRSQALVSVQNVSKKGRRGGGSVDDMNEDGEGTTEDLEAAEPANDDEDEDVGDVSAFAKKHRKASSSSSSAGAAAAKGNGAPGSKAATGGASVLAAKKKSSSAGKQLGKK